MEIASTFLRLGCTSFGGPVAHLGYVREEVVVRRAWLDDARYAELVALCQFLPGPASSQVVFAVGMVRRGLLGACLASLCFTAPSALLMLGFALFVSPHGAVDGAGWLHGLKLAAVAVVAQAVWGLGKKLAHTRGRFAICCATAVALLLSSSTTAQLACIALGAVAGRLWLESPVQVPTSSTEGAEDGSRGPVRGAVLALVLFFALLVALPIASRASAHVVVEVFDRFYRAGALVFGGGHVVLPLLREELVPTGLMDDGVFLAGYGLAQAVPGPLFTLAAFLGASIDSALPRAVVGGVALVAVFLPGLLLVGGALPFWRRLASAAGARGFVAGANAAVVGVLLAALVTPVATEGISSPLDVLLAVIALIALERLRASPVLVVGLLAAAGQALGAFAPPA